ncbi:MAG: polymerase-binding protein DksA [Chlorobi bacterium]|nr:polymerase-binding protein DksA [Chlorobiota bacterium]
MADKNTSKPAAKSTSSSKSGASKPSGSKASGSSKGASKTDSSSKNSLKAGSAKSGISSTGASRAGGSKTVGSKTAASNAGGAKAPAAKPAVSRAGTSSKSATPKKPAPAPEQPKASATKATKSAPQKGGGSAPATSSKAAPAPSTASSQKTATKTKPMAAKQSEPETPTPTPVAEAPVTKTPSKKSASSGKKPAAVKFPKGIFSPATGTASSDPFPEKELEKFRVLIQNLRVDNQDELEVLTEQLREMTSSENTDDNSAYSLHMAEQGTDAMEREKTFLQAQRTNDYIKKLDEAIRRIQVGTFGLCRVCGLRLDSKRLLAVPVTQVCTIYKNTSKPCEPGKIQMEAVGTPGEENE